MSTTKTGITDNITAALTGNGDKTTWDDHENFLKNSDESIVNALYPTPIEDVSIGTKTITESNANFSYTVQFTKVGRSINIKGFFQNISGATQPQGATIFTILPGQTAYLSQSLEAFFGNATKALGSTAETVPIKMDANILSTATIMAINETYRFNFNYNSEN